VAPTSASPLFLSVIFPETENFLADSLPDHPPKGIRKKADKKQIIRILLDILKKLTCWIINHDYFLMMVNSPLTASLMIWEGLTVPGVSKDWGTMWSTVWMISGWINR
jgi:hypothetical protein